MKIIPLPTREPRSFNVRATFHDVLGDRNTKPVNFDTHDDAIEAVKDAAKLFTPGRVTYHVEPVY